MAGIMASVGSMAHARDASQGGISLRAGAGDHYQRYELAWESPSVWNYQFSGGSRLDLVGELGAAYWVASGSRSPSNAGQFSAIPLLRWTVGERYYIEAGVGPTVFTRTHFADETISTAFQFGNHIGVGAYLSESSRVGLRFSHFSNASIKRPNPGLDVLQLTYTYQY
ncbi:MAG TPA: acyloxyacyl hydrolase [Eoetvoesiella sp.]